MDLIRHSARTLVADLRSGAVSALELIDALEARIAAVDGAVNALPTLCFDRAREAARMLEAQPAEERGVLCGLPVAIKDLIDTQGDVTTAASDLYRGNPPAQADAPIAAALDRAGLVFLGKTNLTEFAFSGLGLNPHFGTPHNPHDTTTPRAPGGSSSGSAVAVAAAVAGAVGSEAVAAEVRRNHYRRSVSPPT